ncbi:MAG: LysM peptidoglycan-binding domain-containing protein [Clostridia bacterium]|nr:LysM peptidoglycan-binding domain-containing protein [Clostridia bacterium]MBQ8371772.1 LysM peptidoglycan-binding domain-containing protein [Clostridia bacterium]
MLIHKLQDNESIYDVAEEYGMSVMMLARQNGIEHPKYVGRGRQLVVIPPTKTYNARRGDPLERIADRFGTEVSDLIRINPELMDSRRLYSGQLLAIKIDTPRYGMAAVNGYCYAGTDRRRFTAMLPYTNYVTLCSARSSGCEVAMLFDDRALLEATVAAGKFPVLRIYMAEPPRAGELHDLVNAIKMLIGSKGYRGVAIGNAGILGKDACELMLKLKNALSDDEVTVIAEADLSCETEHTEYADISVLTYDKLHFDSPPSFAEGERAAMERFATEHSSMTAMLELSSFARLGEGFIEKERAGEILTRARCIDFDDEALLCKCEHKGKTLISETAENTKAKLECVSELGFMGISFDMMRLPIREIMLLTAMFSPISMSGRRYQTPRCTGGM